MTSVVTRVLFCFAFIDPDFLRQNYRKQLTDIFGKFTRMFYFEVSRSFTIHTARYFILDQRWM